MSKHFAAEEKIILIQRFMAGESITDICGAAGISRTIFYHWINAYKKTTPQTGKLVLKPKHPAGKNHYRVTNSSVRKRITALALKSPELSARAIARTVGLSVNPVSKELKQRGLLTRKQREQYLHTHPRQQLSSTEKREIIQRFDSGVNIARLCREYGISRAVFYRWLAQYQNASPPEEQLVPKHPKGERHWRYNAEARQLILKVVQLHPTFGVHKISQVLATQTSRKIFSHDAVHKFLKQQHLNTIEQRLKFAETGRLS
jgi:transposase-like protein